MKRLLSFLSLLIVAVSSFAQEFTVGDLTYKVLSTTDKTAQVYNGKTATSAVVVPETVTYNDDDYRVTTIGYQAFYQNANITSVDMPSITSIGSQAFYSCSSLAAVELPAATSIGGYAFCNCSNISSLRIGSVEQWCNVNFGGSYANPLQTTSQTVELYIGDSDTPATNIVVPNTVTSIPDYAFRNTTITSVTAPAATSIGSSAFSYCSSLESVELPAATSIGSSAFSYCSSLESVELPAATSIGSSAFRSCSSLSSVSLPAVTSIGSYAFVSSSNINTLRIGCIEQWCNVNFVDSYANPLYVTSKKVNLYVGDSETPVTKLTIPSGVSQIPAYCYRGLSLHTIHFEGTTPPTLINTNAIPTWTMLAVPDEAFETYLATDVYRDIPLQITKEGCILKEVEVEAENTTSKLLAEIGDKNARYIVNLKVRGTINSYDMMIIRNQMPSLRNLDLSEASIVDCDYEYYAGCHSEKDVVGSYWLYETNVMNVILPQTAKSIGCSAFEKCKSLLSVSMPDEVTIIGAGAFKACSNLHDIELPSKLTTIEAEAFRECRQLSNINIPSSLTYIGWTAFNILALKTYIYHLLLERCLIVFSWT